MTSPQEDPLWPRAGAWLRGEYSPTAPAARVSILGAPLHRGSITPGRCDLAPDAVRRALSRFSTWDFEAGHDIRAVAPRDLGDLDVAELLPAGAFEIVRTGVESALKHEGPLILLGGDNSITRPAVRALADTSLLTFDAHLDLRDTRQGLTNGNPVRALLDDGFPGDRIVQIGIQSFANSPEYAQIAREAGIRVVTAEQVHQRGIAAAVHEAIQSFTTGAIYVDLDIDVLDRAFVPASPGARPGGLMPWQLRQAARICGASPKVRAIDIVEIDPTQDAAGVTSLAAAACILSFVSGVLSRCSPSPTAPKS